LRVVCVIVAAIGFLLGCVALLSMSALPAISLSLLAVPALLVFFKYPKSRFFSAVALGFCWAIFQANLVFSPTLDATLEGDELLLEAEIISLPEVYERKTRFLIKPLKLILPEVDIDLPQRIRISWYQHRQPVKPGERWRFKVRLKQPHGFANPNGFDYEKWLFSQGVRATGYVRDAKTAHKLADAPASINLFRYRLADTLGHELKHLPAAGIITALTLGVRSGISPEGWDTLIQTGTNHLVAISGLHIGLIAALSFWLMNFLWRRLPGFSLRFPAQKAAAIFSILPATGYAVLAGFSVPTQRALIMLLVVVVSLLMSRRIHRAKVLAAALIAVLLFDSLAVLSAGFWLSFFAVATILWSASNASPSIWPPLVRMQFLLVLALTPLTLWFFNQSSLIAPLANLIAVPIVGLITVPLLLAGVLLLFIYAPVGWFLIYMAEKLLSWLSLFLEYLAQLPMAYWQQAIPQLWVLLTVLLGMTMLLAFRGLPGRWLGLVLLLPVLFVKPQSLSEGQFELTVLDIGQGLSAVVRTANHTLVYDTGQRFSDRFNTADAVLLPFLRQFAVNQVDMLVLSHSDSDHAGSANELRDGITISQTLASYQIENLKSNDWDYCEAGQQWQWDGVVFKVLHPKKDWEGVENDRSCVISVENATTKALLTGDIGVRAERVLMKQYGKSLQSEVMLVPHHGSLTSSSPEFIDAIAPDYAVFPVGYRNRYGFPKQAIVERYQAKNIKMLRTDQEGAVKFVFSEGDGVAVDRYRQSHQKLWAATLD